MPNLIGKKEVAEMLDCSVRQVDYLRKEDGLPFVQIGVCVKFRPEAVIAWILKREQGDGTEQTGNAELP